MFIPRSAETRQLFLQQAVPPWLGQAHQHHARLPMSIFPKFPKTPHTRIKTMFIHQTELPTKFAPRLSRTRLRRLYPAVQLPYAEPKTATIK